MDYKDEELKLVDYQLIISGSIGLIIILSLVIGYNFHLKLSDKKPFLSDDEVSKISIFIRILALIATFASLYITIKGLEIAKKKEEDLDTSYLEIAAASLAFIAAILLIIVVFKNSTSPILDVENPEV